MLQRLRARPPWQVALGALAALLLIVGALALTAPPAPCGPRPDDPTGYLVPICEYIRAQEIDVSPGDPTRYRILRTEERVEGGRTIVRVFLSCCYLGDVAEIDKASGEVIDFRAGAK